MDKTAALHRCELCGETVGEEELGGYVEENGPYCMYCFDIAVEIAKSTAWLKDTDLTGTINELREKEKELAQDNMRYTWSSNSRA